MDRVVETLKPENAESYHPAITAAMGLAHDKMDEYYSLTDESNLYRIAMILHPEYKLEYFRQRVWPKKWTNTAEEIFREEYFATYGKETTTSVEPIWKNSTQGSLFKNRPVPNRSHEDELQLYLKSPIVDVGDENLLKWWRSQSQVYPNLHRMALDYLSIPGLSPYPFIWLLLTTYLATSTAVERVFSQGRHLLPYTRNGLSPSSIQAFLCVGSWARCGIIQFSDAVTALSETQTSSAAASSEETPSVVASVEV
jgi:hypothetical protein